MTQGLKEKLLNEIKFQDKVKILEFHDLFKQLRGNPTSISMISKIYDVQKYKNYLASAPTDSSSMIFMDQIEIQQE